MAFPAEIPESRELAYLVVLKNNARQKLLSVCAPCALLYRVLIFSLSLTSKKTTSFRTELVSKVFMIASKQPWRLSTDCSAARWCLSG